MKYLIMVLCLVATFAVYADCKKNQYRPLIYHNQQYYNHPHKYPYKYPYKYPHKHHGYRGGSVYTNPNGVTRAYGHNGGHAIKGPRGHGAVRGPNGTACVKGHYNSGCRNR